ncbi:MAG: ABC transporter permease [Candidatus Diapherotrites archaeon]|nr:ABC transporter permease [Candidatus Diapherotrites archaeon]
MLGKWDSGKAILIIYGLAACTAVFAVFTILYQYVAAWSSWQDVVSAFSNERILVALGLSVTSSFATAFLALVFGIPLAYVFATRSFPARNLIETLVVDVPQTFPPIAEGMILLLMLGPASPFHVNLAFTFSALVIAKFFISAPFVISYVGRRFREIRKSGIDFTARSLGASPFQVLVTIYLPLSFREIAAGTALCWARAMGELGGTLIFAGVIPGKTETIPTYISVSSAMTASALAATILATSASTLALVSFKRITSTAERGFK